MNDDTDPQFIDSAYFTGNVGVRVKNFHGTTPNNTRPISDSKYFGSRKRLFSIQVQGRFKQEYSADDVVFGAEFEHKVSPPTGAWLAVKFANYIDPALITDMYADRPWLYSPMLCSMNTVNVVRATSRVTGGASGVIGPTEPPLRKGPGSEVAMARSKANAVGGLEAGKATPDKVVGLWEWGGEKELKEANKLLLPDSVDTPYFGDEDVAERRKYFNKKEHRENMKFTPDYVYNLEIFAPFIDLNTFDLTLGINVNLLRYLNNQPIRLICKSLSKNVPFFIVEFDLMGDTPIPAPSPEEVSTKLEQPLNDDVDE